MVMLQTDETRHCSISTTVSGPHCYYGRLKMSNLIYALAAGVTIHRTGPHRARTEPEMTDYFTSTTVTSRIKA